MGATVFTILELDDARLALTKPIREQGDDHGMRERLVLFSVTPCRPWCEQPGSGKDRIPPLELDAPSGRLRGEPHGRQHFLKLRIRIDRP